MTYLVTGGAGSIGKELIGTLLRETSETVRVLDWDEYGLFLLRRRFKEHQARLRLLMGDVRDRERMALSMKGADTVFHLAALKNVEVTEYNAPETVSVNVVGSLNAVEAALAAEVSKFVFVSSDKAVEPLTIYGATKLLSEKLVSWASRISDTTRLAVARFGNVYWSRGSVLDVWSQEAKRGVPLTVTDPSVSRFYWGAGDAASFLLRVSSEMKGGEVFVPSRMELLSVGQLADRMFPSSKREVVGLRRDEKQKEALMTPWEVSRSEDRGWAWVLQEG